MKLALLTTAAALAVCACATQPNGNAAAPADAHPYALQLAALHEMARSVNAGEAAKYARLYANDAVITIYGSGDLTGRAAIEAHEVELLRQFPGARLAFDAAWQSGASAVVHYGVACQ